MSNVKLDLAALRFEAAQLTVREACEKAGVSRRTWQRWEKDRKIPAGALKRFCEAVGLNFGRYVL